MVGAFVPYQIMIYPLVRMLALGGFHQTLAAVVLVHVLFGLPILTLIFRNFYAALPPELIKAARVDGAGFFQVWRLIVLPMSVNVAIVAVSFRSRVSGTTTSSASSSPGLLAADDRLRCLALSHRLLGRARPRGQHGGNTPDRAAAAAPLPPLRQILRPRRHRRGGKGMK